MILSKAVYIAFKLYCWLVHAFLGNQTYDLALLAASSTAWNRNEISLQSEQSDSFFFFFFLIVDKNVVLICQNHGHLQSYCITLGYANYHTLIHTTDEIITECLLLVLWLYPPTHTYKLTHRFSQFKCTNPGLAPARVAMVTTMHVWSKYCISALVFLSPSLSLQSSTPVCKVVSWRSEEFYADVIETTEVSDLLELCSFSWCFLLCWLGVYIMLWL